MAFPFFIGYNSKNLIKYSLNSIPMFELLLHLGSILTVAYTLKIMWVIIFKDLKKSNFNLKVKIKSSYQPTLIENTALLLPALALIFLAGTANIYLGYQFDFHYLSGLITTAIYLLVAYLIRFPIMSRIDH
jgi:NADH-quinone oxidoreductase subunit M